MKAELRGRWLQDGCAEELGAAPAMGVPSQASWAHSGRLLCSNKAEDPLGYFLFGQWNPTQPRAVLSPTIT